MMHLDVDPATKAVPAAATSARDQQRNRVARWIGLGALLALLLWIISPFWGWLTLAAWFGAAARPVLGRLASVLGGRNRAAAALTVLLFVAVTLPLGALIASIAADASQLVETMISGGSGTAALAALVTPDATPQAGGPHGTLSDFIEQHGARSIELASDVAGSLGSLFLGLFVFFAASYAILADGARAYAWVELLAPATRANVHRLRAAFLETGRGLFVGAGMTGLVQAVIATVAYFALGVPRALVLGFLTFASSAIPGFGTAIVWVPLAIGFAMSNQLSTAIALAVIGLLFISGIDNLIRPIFMKWGKLELHPFVSLVTMFGAIVLIGPWGILLGPLVARLTIEVIHISREEGEI